MSRYNDEWIPTDVAEGPDVGRLAEKVRDEGKPILLERDGEGLAVLVSVEWARNFGLRAPRTEADREAFLASAGGWEGLIDADRFIKDVYESRRRSACVSSDE